ncbi:12025_t:CDS:2, partial [Ambispora gerdemannii]
ASLVVDGQRQKDKEAIPEVWLSIDNSVSTVDLSNSVVDQQNNADTKSMEEIPKVSDKEIDDFIPEEPIPKEMDSFLDSENKKIVSNLMRGGNREKKLLQSNEASASRTQEPLVMPPTSSKRKAQCLKHQTFTVRPR